MTATAIRPEVNGPYLTPPAGWTSALVSPGLPGAYERISALGVAVDWWDGDAWRRTRKQALFPGRLFPGVVCANQALPWREAVH